MPDISMCTNKECPFKDHCYRYTAEPSEYRQSYTSWQFTIDENNDFHCKGFIDNEFKHLPKLDTP